MLAIQGATRVYEKRIMKKNVPTLSCQMCRQAKETILYLLSACPVQAGTTYVYHHNLVARAVHWYLCKHFLLPLTSKSWFSHNPSPICESSTTKIAVGFPPTIQFPSCQQLPRHCSFFLSPQEDRRSLVLGISLFPLRRMRKLISI